jgi:hypothetical protein
MKKIENLQEMIKNSKKIHASETNKAKVDCYYKFRFFVLNRIWIGFNV